jgi:hypothetical protein
MRSAALFLLATLPLVAQVSERKWNFDLHGLPATLEGNFQGTESGNAISFDLKSDLALQKDKTQPGAAIEYQGRRFGFTLSTDAQDYQGSSVITKKVELNGTTYQVGALVTSQVKLKSYDLNWTIRAFTWQQAWIGVDLGLHAWDLDMTATGTEQTTLLTKTSSEKIPVPIPQVGLSVGGKAFGDRFVSRASFHFLRYKGASYTRWQGDLRYFPLEWLGLRAFLDDESFDVPQGSIKDDLILNIKRSGAGFGVVVRY